MADIKFGTDGWRAVIAREYTVDNVGRVAVAVAQWLKVSRKKNLVVVGYDCRFGGKLFAETTAKVLAQNNITVLLSNSFISTPMLSLGVVKNKAALGIIITASHNPPDYNGFKIKGDYGGPLLEENIKEIEALIPNKNSIDPNSLSLQGFMDKGTIKYVDLEDLYCKHIEANFNLTLIKKSGLTLAYDSMYGAGQNVIKRLLPNAALLHCVHNPLFGGISPEPIERNLKEFETYIKKAKNIDMGLATDGDADRIGLYNGKAQFIDSHHIILLLIRYLVNHKKMKGTVCVAYSVTDKVEKICAAYNLPLKVVKIGFKYVCKVMLDDDVLLGGEESGGIAIKGHIPERDGIWIGLTILEYMARTGKTLDELIAEVLKITGKFAYGRIDLHITEEQKQKVLANCKAQKFNAFGKYKVAKTGTMDGFKFYFPNKEWLMIRASGTEPVLRLYAEAASNFRAKAILSAATDVINKV